MMIRTHRLQWILNLLLSLLLGLTGSGAIFLPVAQAEGATDKRAGLSMLRADGSEVTLELRTPSYALEPCAGDDGHTYLQLQVAGYGTGRVLQQASGQAGGPELPAKRALLGVPSEARVEVEVIAAEERSISLDHDLAPVPRPVVRDQEASQDALDPLVQRGGQIELQFTRDEALYRQDAFFPSELARIAREGYLRDQRFVQVELTPFQYNPARRELRYYPLLQVRVRFVGSQGHSLTPRPEGPFESVLAGAILNYEQAKAWRSPPAPARLQAVGRAGEGPALRIGVPADGLYQLTAADLEEAGLDLATLDPRHLQLTAGEEEVAIEIAGEEDGRFDPEDVLRFYGQATNSRFTEANVYWLGVGSMPGRRMEVRDGSPTGGGTVPQSYEATVHLEENHIYLSDLPRQEEADHWFWNYYNTKYSFLQTLNYIMVVDAPITEAISATLQVQFQGSSSDTFVNPDHHVQLRVNGQWVGEVSWDSQQARVAQAAFPQSYLVEGENIITVEALTDTGTETDSSYIDWLELEYHRAYVADEGTLTFGLDSAGAWDVAVAGFLTETVSLYDVTDPLQVQQIVSVTTTSISETYQLQFTDVVTGPAHYLALTPAEVRGPLSVELDTPSQLTSPDNGADYILITHRDFYTHVLPLAAHRQAQGLRVAVVDVQDIYDEFSYGMLTPQAIRDFLAYAYANWQPPAPSYVLLVGDGTYDFRDYLGTGTRTTIPPYLGMVDPFMGETASDNRYVTLSGEDMLPDMNIGRLPANSPVEAQAMVDKILAYESTPLEEDWHRSLLFVADNDDQAGHFTQMSDSIADALPSPYQAQKVYYGSTHTDPLSAREAIVQAINEGQLLVNYVGHASSTWWASEILFGVDEGLPALTNGSRLPVMVPMTCWEGYFISPYYPALGESVVRAEGKGAVASWSPTGQGIATGHQYLHEGLIEALFEQDVYQLGPATTWGKLNLYDKEDRFLDLIDTYLLFGDPAMSIATLPADLSVTGQVAPEGVLFQGDPITYTVTYTNGGWSLARGVVLTTTVPQGLVDLQVEAEGAEITLQSGTKYVWDVEDLAQGEGGTVVINGRVDPHLDPDLALLKGGASIYTWWRDSDQDNNSAGPFIIEIPPADLSIELAVAPVRPMFPGESLTYTLSYSNRGPGLATDTVISLPLPAGLAASELHFDGPALTEIGDEPYMWEAGSLAPGEGGVITLVTTIVSDITADSLPLTTRTTITTSWLDSDPGNNNSPEHSAIVLIPDRYEPDDTPSQAWELSVPGVFADHTYHYFNDQDWGRFQAQRGSLYSFEATNISGWGDTIVALYGDDGRTLLAKGQGVPSGEPGSSRIEHWEPPAEGTYYLMVTGRADGDYGYSYDLLIRVTYQVFLPLMMRNYAAPLPPTPTPTPTLTPSPTPTQTPEPTATPTPTASPIVPTPCVPVEVLTLELGAQPRGLAAQDGRVYAGLWELNGLALIDASSGEVLTTTVGGGSHANGVAVLDGRVYLAHRDSREVSVFDAGSGAFLHTIEVGDLPFGVAAAEGRVYVANFGSGTVSVIDADTQQVIATPWLGGYPSQIATADDRAFVTDFEGRLLILSREGQLIGKVKMGEGAFGVAYDAERDRIYVGSREEQEIAIVDATTLQVVDAIHLPGTPYALGVNPASDHLFAVDAEDDVLYAIDLSDHSLIATLPLRAQGMDGGQGLALWDSRLFVANYEAQSLTVFDDSPCTGQFAIEQFSH